MQLKGNWIFLLTMVLLTGVAFGVSADAIDHKASPLAGDFMEYSGELDDTDLPKKNDAKVAITLTGKLAIDMFKFLGPSARHQSCLDNEETRTRGDLTCISGGDRRVVECYIGIDLRKGRSINGVIC